MNKQNNIELLLKIHGVEASASDEVIRSILLSANYSQDEIDKAILTLRESKDRSLILSTGLHKLFHTDLSLKPNEVHALLGIDIEIRKVEVNNQKNQGNSLYQSILLVVLAFFLAFSGVMLSMYGSQVGPFHSEASYFAR